MGGVPTQPGLRAVQQASIRQGGGPRADPSGALSNQPMTHERHPYERFQPLREVQQELEKEGFYYYPVEREHAEALVTEPLVHRIRTKMKKRGFERVAGRVAVSFSGYA